MHKLWRVQKGFDLLSFFFKLEEASNFELFLEECAKFNRSHTIMGLDSSYFHGSLIFSCWYFMGLKLLLIGSKFFLVIISWVWNFSRGYFLDPKFCVVGIYWVWNSFLSIFCGSNIFSWGYLWATREYMWGLRINECHTPPPINTT